MSHETIYKSLYIQVDAVSCGGNWPAVPADRPGPSRAPRAALFERRGERIADMVMISERPVRGSKTGPCPATGKVTW